MHRWLLLLCLCGGPSLLGQVELRAEVFVLRHGGRVEGTWLNRDAGHPELYEIDLARGGRLSLSSELVTEVLSPHEPSSPEAPEAADPADGTEREEWLARHGYVRYKGGWRLAQEVELESRGERRVIEEREWRKRLRVWRNAVVRGRSEGTDALTQLRAVNSPFAIAPLAEMLADAEEPTQLKLLYIELLGKFQHASAVTALLERTLQDPDPEVRERSVDALRTCGLQQALAVLTRALKDKDNQVVNQAAWALGRLGDPAAIPALMEAVVTKHRFQVQTGSGPGGISGGFSPQGGGGLQAGGSVKIIERELQNRQVLSALTALTPPSVNFGYDKAAWKNWYAQQQVPRHGNLRRDL